MTPNPYRCDWCDRVLPLPAGRCKDCCAQELQQRYAQDLKKLLETPLQSLERMRLEAARP